MNVLLLLLFLLHVIYVAYVRLSAKQSALYRNDGMLSISFHFQFKKIHLF